MKRKLAAILSVGAEGYSRLMGENEAGTFNALKAHLQVMGSLVEKHRGFVAAIHGDSLLAVFDSVVDAVQCGEAVKACEEGIKRAPEGMLVHVFATAVFSGCGKEKEARKTAKELLRINPKFSAESFAKRLPW